MGECKWIDYTLPDYKRFETCRNQVPPPLYIYNRPSKILDLDSMSYLLFLHFVSTVTTPTVEFQALGRTELLASL